jgi:malate permease and related proteins
MLFIDIVLPVFLIVATGYWLQKQFNPDIQTITNISLYLFTPAMVFSALNKSTIDLGMAGDITLFMVLYTAILLVIALLSGKLFRYDFEKRRALALSTTMMNCGNFGLPLVYFAFGEPGLGFSVLTFVIFSIPLSTLGIMLAQKEKTDWRKSLLNTLRIPIFHAVILALVVNLLQVPLAKFIVRPIDLLGQAAIPLLLVMLGMQLARTSIKRELGFLCQATLIRLLLAPLLAWGLTTLLGINGLAQKVVILQTSTPAAVLPLLYSLRYGTRPDLVATAVVLTTFISAGSLTMLLYLL